MQSIGWTLFAVTLSLVLVGLKEYDSLVSLPIHGLITSVGCLGLIAQIFLLASLDHFDHTNGTVATSNINTAIPAPIAASNNQTLPSSVPIISDVYDSHTPLPPIGVLPFVKDGTYPWTGEALVSIIFALGGLCLFIIVDAVKSYYHRTFLSSLLASIANIDERPPYNPPAGPLPTLYISVLVSVPILLAPLLRWITVCVCTFDDVCAGLYLTVDSESGGAYEWLQSSCGISILSTLQWRI